MFRRLMSTHSHQHLQNPVLFETKGHVEFVTLNRVGALNALNLDMVRVMLQHYQKAMRSSEVSVVVLKGVGEKAFCAGGDVVGIYHAGKSAKANKTKIPSDFFREEYHCDYTIACLNKPHVAIIDGITMGGGVGVSVHGTFRVATERSLFAMPETGIGLFPDVGGSYFLPRLPLKHYGRHIALTGGRVKGAALKTLGVATHCIPSSSLNDLYDALSKLPKFCSDFQVSNTIEKFETLPPTPVATEEELAKIAQVFETDSFDEYWSRLSALRDKGDQWAAATMKTIESMSPTSVKVTFEQLVRGSKLSLAECFDMEFTMVQRFLREHDFYEGVRAQLVDKDKAPKWKPTTLADVSHNVVQSYFKNDNDFDPLRMPMYGKGASRL